MTRHIFDPFRNLLDIGRQHLSSADNVYSDSVPVQQRSAEREFKNTEQPGRQPHACSKACQQEFIVPFLRHLNQFGFCKVHECGDLFFGPFEILNREGIHAYAANVKLQTNIQYLR